MSRTRYVGGNITEITGGSHKIFAGKDIENSSMKQVVQVGNKGGVTHNKNKKSPKKVDTISLALVEFRTMPNYKGEFGFDWLRIDDGTLTLEPAYESIITSGYEAPNGKVPHRDSNSEYETPAEAFKALKKEYDKVTVKKVAPPDAEYFVPWLNIFPKPYSDSITTMPKPPCEAELKILIQVDGTDEPDKIRVEFSKTYFEINDKDGADANPVLITDKSIGIKRKATDTLKIKCIAEFATTQEIKVYAYPKGSNGKTPAELMGLKKLVGKIMVGANDATNRKVQKFVFVKLKTNNTGVIGNDVEGIFNPIEKTNLYNALYQGLIFPEIPADIILDVTNNDNFKVVGSRGTKGKYVDTFGRIVRTEPTLNSYMRQLVNQMTANRHIGSFYAFCFNLEDSTRNVGGRVEDIGLKSVVLYKGRDNFTLNHESLHGLGLLHTHKDGVITNPNQKFTYPHASTNPTNATDNVMSYQPDGRTTWHWQWKIIKKNIT